MYDFLCESSPSTDSDIQHSPFKSGTLIRLSGNKVKVIDELTSNDFVHDMSPEEGGKFRLDGATVKNISPSGENNSYLLDLAVDDEQVFLEVPGNHPFFVIGSGWSSCDPVRSFSKYGLCCSSLKTGDCLYVLKKRSESKMQDLELSKNIWRPLSEH